MPSKDEKKAPPTDGGTREDLIKSLNGDLAREYQAHHRVRSLFAGAEGAEYMNIADELEKHAGEELQHAITIANQIDYLGGTPTVSPSRLNRRTTIKKCCVPI